MSIVQPDNPDDVPKVAARLPWGLIALVTLSCVAMVIITPVDYAWTQWLVLHNNGIFSNIIGRTLFEGKLPGAGDLVVIAQAVIVVLFVLPGRVRRPLSGLRRGGRDWDSCSSMA